MADSLALAVLETLVHLEATKAAQPFVAIEVSVPDDAVTKPTDLASGWEHELAVTRDLGSDWLGVGRSLALYVPSALVPDGGNLLVNPAHAAAVRLKETRRLEFRWDDRLF